jgi:hypothetical protein
MFKTNVGGFDRILRIVVGLVLLLGFFLGWGGSLNWLLLIGIVPLATGILQTCPAYALLGINTCPMKR